MPVSIHSDSANGNILLLTNIVYVINKKKEILSFQLICPLLSFYAKCENLLASATGGRHFISTAHAHVLIV